MPEFSLLRRSSLVAAWLAPYTPGLSANDEAVELPTSLSELSPDAFRGAACLDTESRLSTRNVDFADGDGGGGLTQGGSWDPGELAMDGASGVLGTRFLTLSSMRVPVRRDGPFIVGYIVTEVVLDRMSRHSYGLAFFPPLSRFALDTSTGQLTTAAARSDGQAVCWSGLTAAPPGQDGGGSCGGDAECGGSGGGGNVYWLSSIFLRPSLGQRQPTLATRTSTLMKATVPKDKVVTLPPDWANVPPGPLTDFCRAMAGGATFGAASVSTESPFGSSVSASSEGGDPTGRLVDGGRESTCSDVVWPVTDGVFSMVTTVEPSSRSVLQRLCSLALTHVAVQPARMRLPPPAQAPPAEARLLALRRSATASSMAVGRQRAGGGGGAHPASASAFATSGGGSNGGGNNGGGAPSVCASASAVAPTASGAVAGSGTTHRRRRRQRVLLESVTDERVARRIVRNRKSAAAANERRRLERERERAREDAEDAVAAAAAAAAAAPAGAAAAMDATAAEKAGKS